MKKLIYIIALLTSLSAHAQIKGRIYSLPDSLPVKGATVTIANKSTQTDQNGVFTFSMAAGKYFIQVQYLGYLTLEKDMFMDDRSAIFAIYHASSE